MVGLVALTLPYVSHRTGTKNRLLRPTWPPTEAESCLATHTLADELLVWLQALPEFNAPNFDDLSHAEIEALGFRRNDEFANTVPTHRCC